jgi:methyl-accepting chemotaxis protein
MDSKLINRIRIKLLAQCFGISGITVMILIVSLRDIFYFVSEMLLAAGVWILIVLTTTGIIQIIFNEKWLTPLIKFWGTQQAKEPAQKTSSSPLRTASFMFFFCVVAVVIGVALVSLFLDILWRHKLILAGVGLGVGFSLSLLWYTILRSRAESSSRGVEPSRAVVEAGKAVLIFPLKSAGLSLFLWFYAGIAFGLGLYYFADISRIQTFYIFIMATCAGALAFPLQYFLFKRTLSKFLDLVASRGGELLLREDLFKISIRYKLLVSFVALIIFAVALPALINHSITIEIIKNRVAKMGDGRLQFLIERLKESQLSNPPEWETIEEELTQLDEGSESSSFILNQSRETLFGTLPEIMKEEYIKEMIQKKEGSFTWLKSDEVIVYRSFPDQPWILGTVYPWHVIGSDISKIRHYTLIIGLIALLICIAVAFLSAEDTGKPLASMVAQTERITEGDFTDELPVLSEDELGNLGKSFQQMSQSIRHQVKRSERLIKNIRDAIERLDSSTSGILGLANYQASGAIQQATAVQESITVSEEVVATAKQISESASSVEKEAAQTSVACERGKEVLNNTKKAVADVQEMMKSIVASMNVLGKHSEEIQGIVKIIEEISDQTNLLALNASIEAASAGEAGKRFAVVASETRRLAGMTEEANSQINALIEEIQKSISDTITLTERGGKAVETSAGLLDQGVESFKDFSSLVEISTLTTKEISLSTKQQTTALEQMASSVSEINKVAQNVVGSADEIKSALNELKKLAESLTTLIRVEEANA